MAARRMAACRCVAPVCRGSAVPRRVILNMLHAGHAYAGMRLELPRPAHPSAPHTGSEARIQALAPMLLPLETPQRPAALAAAATPQADRPRKSCWFNEETSDDDAIALSAVPLPHLCNSGGQQPPDDPATIAAPVACAAPADRELPTLLVVAVVAVPHGTASRSERLGDVLARELPGVARFLAQQVRMFPLHAL